MSSSAQSTQKASILDVSTDTSAATDPNLAPPRKTPGMRKDVKPPFANTPLSTFVYTISIGAALLAAFFALRAVEWKSDNGMGVFNLLFGKNFDNAAGAANPNAAAGSSGEMDMDATVDI